MEIFDEYMKKLQKLIWNIRCEDTIELEKLMGITKDLKRRKKWDRETDEDNDDSNNRSIDKIENQKTKKKIKIATKIMMIENSKNDVFSSGNNNKSSWGNKLVSNLLDT